MSEVYQKAKQLVRAEQIEPALKLFLELEKTEPSPELLNDIGVCFYLLGDFERAIDYFECSLEKNSDFSLAKINKFYLERTSELLKSSDLRYQQIHHDGLLSNTPPPQISVIIPTYNRPKLLKEALLSLKNQTFKDFETIVVNDGGDKTAEKIIKEVKLPKIRYYYTSHRGPTYALNRGLEMARGKYIAFLDDDDIFYPKHLELLYQRLEQEKSPAIAYSNVKINYYKGDKLIKTEIRRIEKINSEKAIIKSINTPIMVSRKCFEQVGKFMEALAMDGWIKEMWFRLYKSFLFYHVDEITYEYRNFLNSSQLSRQDPFIREYYRNLALYLHQVIKLFSFPQHLGEEKFYHQSIKELSKLLKKYPQVLQALRLRNYWTSQKIYGFFYDHYQIFKKIGKNQIALDFLNSALSLKPLEPKLWIKYISFLKK